MATEAARLERKESTARKKKKHLTHTGLLMEGTDKFLRAIPASDYCSFGFGGEEDGDLGIGVFPEGEEVLIRGATIRATWRPAPVPSASPQYPCC
jgi:hypothetical protein